tara:strand:- start:110 stop:442 length:333 start_codon:yes stop_codon:yes gene_type:complete
MNVHPQKNGKEFIPTLFDCIDDAINLAQDLAMPPTPEMQGSRLREELVPALLESRLYVEIGEIRRIEVRSGLSRALKSAYQLADADRKYSPLVNKLRVLLDDADIVRRER